MVNSAPVKGLYLRPMSAVPSLPLVNRAACFPAADILPEASKS